jgi:hypothetical protein
MVEILFKICICRTTVVKRLDCIFSFLLYYVAWIVSRIYWTVAKILNDFQNHRTETDYQDSLVSTIFVVQFAYNFFYPTFFAFVKPFTDYQCVGQSCMRELSQVLQT